MTPREIAERMAQDAEGVASHLLACGKRHGDEWCCGSIAGNEGNSLKVKLSGPKAGIWRDFADSAKGGDLLDLWKCARGIPMSQAIKEAKDYLGIRDERDVFHPTQAKPRPVERPKEHKAIPEESEIDAWFTKRGISRKTIKAYKVGGSGSVIVFPCVHDGQPLLFKYRDISQAKKIWASKDSTPVLFGWQAVSDDARSIVLTEGELDAMAYYEHGIEAMSVPFGAGGGGKQAWIEYELDRLERFDTIYISTDMDKEGEIAAQEIIERLGRHRCKRVVLPMKDANEVHLAGGSLAAMVAEAKHVDPAELREACSFMDEVIEQFFPQNTGALGTETPWGVIKDDFRLRPAELTIVTGINGHGKTMLLDHMMTHGMSVNTRWCVASMEMPAPVHLKRVVSQICGPMLPNTKDVVSRAMRWTEGRCWIFNVRGTTKAHRIIEVFRYAWRKYGIHHFIVDSLAKCGFAEDDYNTQKQFVEQLQDFAQETHTHVFLVTHARKRDDEYDPPGKMDVKGSGGITDMADNVLAVWRNKKKEDLVQSGGVPSQDDSDALLIVHKQRNKGWEGKVKLSYDRVCHQYLDKTGRLINYMDRI
jgi:twinkle protein